jgi:hypothetical protein
MVTKDTPITFGKYQGFTPNELSASDEGRSYLSWGADNLKSPQWQQAFREALKNRNYDETAVRKMAEKTWREADWRHEDPYGKFMDEQVTEAREQEARSRKEQEIYQKWAAVFGKSTEWLSGVYFRFGRDVSRQNFTSDEKFGNYLAFCDEIDDLWTP